MGFDELDDLLDAEDELEARFRELEARVEADELRSKARRGSGRERARARQAADRTDDPLADLKATVQGKPTALFLVVLCQGCGAKNRVPLERVRSELPVCGRCRADLARRRTRPS